MIPGGVDPEFENYFGKPQRECPETYRTIFAYEDGDAERLCKPAFIAAADFVTAGESYSWDFSDADGIEVQLCEDCSNGFAEAMEKLGDDYQKYEIIDGTDRGDAGDYFASFRICTANKHQYAPLYTPYYQSFPSIKRKADESRASNVRKKAKTLANDGDSETSLFTMPSAGAHSEKSSSPRMCIRRA